MTPHCHCGDHGFDSRTPRHFHMDKDQTKAKAKIEADLAKARQTLNESLAKKKNGKKENVWELVRNVNDLQEKLKTFK